MSPMPQSVVPLAGRPGMPGVPGGCARRVNPYRRRVSIATGVACSPLLGALALGATACGPGTPPAGAFPDIVADASTPSDAGADGVSPDAQEPELVGDGTWLLWAETSSCVGIGRLGLQGLTEALGLVELTYEPGGVLRHAFRKCHVQQTPILGMATTIPDAVSQSVPERSYVGLVDSLAVGSGYQTQLDVELWGVHLTDPKNEVLPTDPSDPRVYDQDGDGHPGVSLVLGDNTCQMYVVQRGLMKWNGQVVSPTRIEGGGSSTSQQVVLASTGGFCATSYDTWFPPDDARFALVRVDGKHGAMNLDTDGNGEVSCDEAEAYGVDAFGPRQPDNEVCAAGPSSR